MADIVPLSSARQIDPLGRVDGCPECVYNTEPPFDAYPTIGGYVASYICSDCGHKWSTAWSEC